MAGPIAPEVLEAIAAEIESQMQAQAEKDKCPVYVEYANMLKAFTEAGALKWVVAGFCMYAYWAQFLKH